MLCDIFGITTGTGSRIFITWIMMRKNNVSARASTATRRVATSRVHIERMIRQLKLFNFVRGVIPLSCKPYVSSVVTVCAILIN